MGFDFAVDPGVMQSLEATGGLRYTGSTQGDNVLVAYTQNGDIAGALSFSKNTFPNGKMDLTIEHAGSTGIIDGAGSALTQSIFKIASDEGRSITLDALPDARKFWTKMGFASDFGGSLMNMTAENVKKAAGK